MYVNNRMQQMIIVNKMKRAKERMFLFDQVKILPVFWCIVFLCLQILFYVLMIK